MRRNIKFVGLCGLLCLAAGSLPSLVRADNYVLLIGVAKYAQKGIPSLEVDINDVHGLEQAFLKNAGYARDHVIVMTTEAKPEDPNYPVSANIFKKLRSLQSLKADDTLFVYFSGHGTASGAAQYLLFADADMPLLERTAISLKVLHDELDKIGARQKVVILDACRNDANFAGLPASAKDINPALQKGLAAEAAQITSIPIPTTFINLFLRVPPDRKRKFSLPVPTTAFFLTT